MYQSNKMSTKCGLNDLLTNVNQSFLSCYKERKQEVKCTLGVEMPVLILNGDDLILRHQGRRIQETYVSEHYHQLKSIAHIACLIHTLYVLPSPIARDKIIRHIEEIRAAVQANKLKKYIPVLDEYVKILQEGKSGIHSLIKLKAPLNQMIQEAAIDRIDALDERVNNLKADLGHDWDTLSVIVMGPPMPREGELGMQYFYSALSAEKSPCPHISSSLTNSAHAFQGKRLIYAESIDEEDKALDLLVTHICDEKMGEEVLGDPSVMRGDILRDATERYLREKTRNKE